MVVDVEVTLVDALVVSLAMAVAVVVVAVPMASGVDMRGAEEAVAPTSMWMTNQPSPLWASAAYRSQQALTI